MSAVIYSNSYKKRPSYQNIVGFLAVLALVSVNIGDIHSHFCLDGQEPAVSLHFENLNGHPEHIGDEQAHNDYENEFSLKSLKTKTSDLSKLFFSTSELGIPRASSISQKISPMLDEILLPNKPNSVRPPLRAPPLLIS